MIIGLTGKIGSGKSTAASVLAEEGAIIVDADRIGREVVSDNKTLLRRLVRRFGEGILTPSGDLKRKEVARRAFSDRTAKTDLDQIVHPHLLKELRKQVRQAKRGGRTVVVDAALLLDWQYDRECDCVLVIHSKLETRIKRMKKRGFDRAQIIAFNRRQLPFSEYRERSDKVIHNEGSARELRDKVRRWYRSLG